MSIRNRHIALGAVLLFALLFLIPFAAVGFAIWLSGQTHRFGPYDLRYVLLVHGTSVGRLGVLAPESGTIAYAARGQDGNSPARVHVTFRTKTEPSRVIDAYRSRCRALRLETKEAPSGGDRLECNGPQGDEIGVSATRRGDLTEVTLGGWVF